MMTLKGLKKKVKELAKDRYHHVRRDIAGYSSGEIEERYGGYIHGFDWTKDCETPEEVLSELKKMIKEKGGE